MWYEVIPPFAIIAGAICVSGFGLKIVDWFECEGKPPRWNIDGFAFRMMERDKTITGSTYRQKVPDTE
eukprot:Seg1213.11 transcript_id=Seg1213.11/GoldUCD/mRNA.D3Y31 product="hypothetical protein" protein_id=Seg1213.11/GoldUCD/D3Y31